MPIPKLFVTCLLAGIFSAVLCWTGGAWLGDASALNKPYPGIVLGLVLFALGEYLHLAPTLRGVWSALIMIVFAVAGWRLSINVGYEYGQPVPYVAAGVVGAFCVATGALFAWRIVRRRVLFVLIITGAGALGGLVFQVLETLFNMSDDIWVLVLYLEWQIILLLGVGLALASAARNVSLCSHGADHGYR